MKKLLTILYHKYFHIWKYSNPCNRTCTVCGVTEIQMAYGCVRCSHWETQ